MLCAVTDPVDSAAQSYVSDFLSFFSDMSTMRNQTLKITIFSLDTFKFEFRLHTLSVPNKFNVSTLMLKLNNILGWVNGNMSIPSSF